jgi:hypothetical protein
MIDDHAVRSSSSGIHDDLTGANHHEISRLRHFQAVTGVFWSSPTLHLSREGARQLREAMRLRLEGRSRRSYGGDELDSDST